MQQEPQKKFELPVNLDAERSVLGAIMIDHAGIHKIDHIVTAQDFHDNANRHIYEAMFNLTNDNIEIDVVTLCDELKNMGYLDMIGGPVALTELTNDVPTAAHIVQYAKLVAKYAALRRILEAARDIGKMTQNYDGNLDTLLLKAEERLKGVTRDASRQQSKLELADLSDYMQYAIDNPTPEGQIQGLSTGLQKLDMMTQGFEPGELMIISGQTSHGKTQLANNIIKKAVDLGNTVMFVTMEMTKRQIGERFNMLSDGVVMPKGKVKLNMRSDLAYTDVTRLIEKAKEQGHSLVVIDHLHYFSRSIENATAEISKIVKEFKQAAVLYELPVILICHVRKMDPKKHPTIEHLRDSSLIAQDADMVLMVWRDESPSASNPHEVEVTLWKNRNRQKTHRRCTLFADGMKLVETEPQTEDYLKRRQMVQDTNRMLGEKDDDDIGIEDLEGFGETDLSILPEFETNTGK